MNFQKQTLAARAKIDTLKRERAGILASPRSRAQVAALVEERLASFAIAGAADRQLAVERLAAGQQAGLFMVSATAVTAQGPVSVNVNMGPILAQLFGAEVLRKALETAVQNIPEGMTPEAREERLAAIAAELDRLQTQEESHIRDAELTGEIIPRRLDAEARFVLALDTP